MSNKVLRWVGVFAIVSTLIACLPGPTGNAETIKSNNFRFDESTLGAGGLIQSNSANYQGSSSNSDIAVGESASSNYQIGSGSQTTNDPTLSFAVNTSSANFGNFSSSTASVTTATFSVINYTSYGYVVQLVGTPPKNGNYTIPALTTGTTSQTGTEQFGVNLVANTSPTSVGANPVNDSIFGFGGPSMNYGTANKFRFVSGETIAASPKSSGRTNYTLSYLVNVGSLTPGGQYSSNQTLIVTGTY